MRQGLIAQNSLLSTSVIGGSSSLTAPTPADSMPFKELTKMSKTTPAMAELMSEVSQLRSKKSEVAPNSLDSEQLRSFQKFDSDIETVIQDEKYNFCNLVNLIILQEIIKKYFQSSDEDPVTRCIRQVPANDMLANLASVRFGQKNRDMILATITLMDNKFIEFLVKPQDFKSSIHPVDIFTSTKTTNSQIFQFVLESTLNQFMLFKSTVSKGHSYKYTDPFKPMVVPFRDDKARIDIMRSLINLCLRFVVSLSENGKQHRTNFQKGQPPVGLLNFSSCLPAPLTRISGSLINFFL